MAKKVLITGGSGLVGSRLTPLLQKAGFQVAWLGRSGEAPEGGVGYRWDLEKGTLDAEATEDVHAVIHLAGAGVADKRWTAERKEVIMDSRVNTIGLLYDAFDKAGKAPSVVLSASGIAYYGVDTGEELVTEAHKVGPDFLSEVSLAWELAADRFVALDSRVVKFRIGVVLAKEGGALDRLKPITKWGLASPLGSGKQYMSWIHIDDLCQQFLFALQNDSVRGTYNAVAPSSVTNKEFTKTMAQVMGKPMWLPNVPGFAMRLAFGDMADILLGGNRVSSQAIQDAGFIFKFPALRKAMENLL